MPWECQGFDSKLVRLKGLPLLSLPPSVGRFDSKLVRLKELMP